MSSSRAFRLLAALLPAFAGAADRKPPPGVELPRIIQTVEARFPHVLAQRGIYDGEARVVMLIDAEGRLADWLLLSYSHPLIGREATEALRQWRFEPARRHGERIDARVDLQFSFQASGMVVSMNGADLADRLQLPQREVIQRVCLPRELDAPLRPVRQVRPLWPADFSGDKQARVALEFFVDEEGRARMPVVRETDDDALVLPAIEALSHWRFEPPTRGGAPVIVRAVQSFRFHRRPSGGEEPKS